MARLDSSGLDQLLQDMEKMGQSSGEVAEAMVTAGAMEIRDAWKESAEAHGHIDTGAMIDSVAFAGPVVNMGSLLYRDVTAKGKDRHGVRNAEKAFILNYGSSRIKPSYWVDEAEAKAEPRIQERLEGMWGEFLETGRVPAVPDSSGSHGKGTRTIKT